MARILVIGAGPAGSAAAITLARRGHDVVVVDRATFPRDKVCGDALIPDSIAALDRLSLLDAVCRSALRLEDLSIYSPNGTEVRLKGAFAALSRDRFDALLLAEAVRAGATFLSPWHVTGPRMNGDRVAGADFVHPTTGETRHVEADVTLLATGAAAGPLQAFGVCTRAEPSAMAARAYFQLPASAAADLQRLVISYDDAVCPGYGWIFPGPDGIFNVGVGVFRDEGSPARPVNLRRLWEAFLDRFAPAARIVRDGRALSDLKGAPLRTAMAGAVFHRPGLLVLGEAAGLTFSFSGEGIGKALDSGLLAGELVDEIGAGSALGPRYAAEIETRYRRLFQSYRRVQRWLAWPVVCNLVAWRASRSPAVRRRLEGVLAERVDPSVLFSVRGLVAPKTDAGSRF